MLALSTAVAEGAVHVARLHMEVVAEEDADGAVATRSGRLSESQRFANMLITKQLKTPLPCHYVEVRVNAEALQMLHLTSEHFEADGAEFIAYSNRPPPKSTTLVADFRNKGDGTQSPLIGARPSIPSVFKLSKPVLGGALDATLAAAAKPSLKQAAELTNHEIMITDCTS
jgi:hypothetical protein